MSRTFFAFLAVVLALGLGCVTRQTPLSKSLKRQTYFTYTNPIKNGIIDGIRDAQVFFDDGKYYMTGTSSEFWKGPNPGVRLYSSDDLNNWQYEALLIDRGTLDSAVWYYDRFWAPEIHKINGKYYLLFNARNETQTHPHRHATAVAVADRLKGPYTVITHQHPFGPGNDLSFFQDDDGKVYAYFNTAKLMNGAEVDLQQMVMKSDPIPLFRPDSATWDAIGIEGPYVIKRNGIYYMFYSSWSRGYEIGYATATHPLGPWTKYAGNPIYGAQDENACRKNGLPYTGNPANAFRAVGHNEVFTGPDGRLWLSCHGILKGSSQQPFLVIDPIDFDEAGNIIAKEPTHSPQRIRIGK